MKIQLIACLFTGFFFFSSKAYPQNAQEIDSLLLLDFDQFDDSTKLEIYLRIARNNRDLDTTIKYANKILDLAYDDNWLSVGHNLMGQSTHFKGQYETALYHYFEHLRLSQNRSASYAIGLSYIAIADTYKAAGDRVNSEKYYLLAITHFQKNESEHDSIYLALAYLNYADFFITELEYAKAKELLLKADQLAELLKYKYRMAHNYSALVLGNLGIVNSEIGDKQVAEEQMIKSIELTYQEIQDYRFASEMLVYLADFYRKQGRYQEAIESLNESITISEDQQLMNGLRDGYQKMALVNQEIGNFNQAYLYLNKHIAIRDSINNEEVIQRMADQRTEYEVGLKQAELDVVEAQSQFQRTLLIGLGIVLFVFLILIVLIVRARNALAKTNVLLDQQKVRLEQLNDSKDKFFSLVSHDIRGPVSAFQGVPAMIQYGLETKNEQFLTEVADEMGKSVTHLSGMLDELLSWAMQQQGQVRVEKQEFSLNDCVDSVIGAFHNTAKGKSITLTSGCEPNLTVTGDRNMVSTIVRNLVNNALKFTNPGGEVKVDVRSDKHAVKLTVSDTGVGMKPELAGSLFEFKGRKSEFGTSGEKGLGLGLQLVYEFVQLHGGKIAVESELGKGSTFRVELPVLNL